MIRLILRNQSWIVAGNSHSRLLWPNKVWKLWHLLLHLLPRVFNWLRALHLQARPGPCRCMSYTQQCYYLARCMHLMLNCAPWTASSKVIPLCAYCFISFFYRVNIVLGVFRSNHETRVEWAVHFCPSVFWRSCHLSLHCASLFINASGSVKECPQA